MSTLTLGPQDGGKSPSVPLEIWHQIVSYDTKTLGRANRVCRSFHDLTQFELNRRELMKIMPETVEIKKGAFVMGPNAEEAQRFNKIRFWVQIEKDFRMAVDPVTQEQFEAVTGKGWRPYPFKGPRLPMTTLTRHEEDAYIARLNERIAELWEQLYPGSGLAPKFRKPTEREWEYATTDPLPAPIEIEVNGQVVEITAAQMEYSGTNEESELWRYAAYGDMYGGGPSPVGEVDPNSRGIRGLSGNVFERTATLWSEDPQVEGTDRSKISIRGGYWVLDPTAFKAAQRGYVQDNGADTNLGFRLVSE